MNRDTIIPKGNNMTRKIELAKSDQNLTTSKDDLVTNQENQ